MQPPSFEETVDRITSQDSRYTRDAYLFLREALDYTQRQVLQTKSGPGRHVTGRELLAGIRAYALRQYGPMTKTLLAEWGIRRCEDFGEIVFNMVDHGLLSKTETDSRADFAGAYDFDDAFCRPFRPRAGEPSPAPLLPKTGSI